MKLHAVADARGRPVRRGLTAGQHHDAPQALRLLSDLTPAYLIADRGYDFDPLVAILAARGTYAIILVWHKRRHLRAFEAARYTQSHSIERLFGRLKQFCRVATRYYKLDALS